MKNEVHNFLIAGVKVTLTLKEEKDRVEVYIKAEKGMRGDHTAELEKCVIPILEKYDTDPRPFKFKHPVSGETALVFGDKDRHICFIKPPKLDGN